ncbi:MAG: pantetheine-phosphate adenylyltransferase [Bacteroidales bacterium]|nr:pantetheine-phosphate adenylyltransferase [Bacteroidales bacterium]
MKTAIFPGSFDPFTLGHLEVLKSALTIFDKVIIAIGNNSSKHGFFPIEVKQQIVRDAIKDIPNVEVCTFTGLTVDLCIEKGAQFLVRGMRTTTDFELERAISQANHKMHPSIQTVFIPSSHEFSFISSTVVRDILVNGGTAEGFLPPNIDIAKYLKSRE